MLLTALLVSLCGDVGSAGAQVRLTDVPTQALVSTEQLEADLSAVMQLRPSIGLPVALLVVGATSTAFGGLMLGLAALVSFGAVTLEHPLIIMALIFAGLGLPFMSVGVWLLSDRLDARKHVSQVADELRRELYERRRWGAQRELAPARTSMAMVATF